MNARTERVIVTSFGVLAGILYAFAEFLPYPHQSLSSEASAYQELAFEVVSGFSLNFALAKLLLLMAAIVWILSLLLMGFGKKLGVSMYAALPLPLALASYLNGAEAAYPFLDKPLPTFLLCAASAVWSGIVCYTTVKSGDLF